jgi:hypothetical protein
MRLRDVIWPLVIFAAGMFAWWRLGEWAIAKWDLVSHSCFRRLLCHRMVH